MVNWLGRTNSNAVFLKNQMILNIKGGKLTSTIASTFPNRITVQSSGLFSIMVKKYDGSWESLVSEFF